MLASVIKYFWTWLLIGCRVCHDRNSLFTKMISACFSSILCPTSSHSVIAMVMSPHVVTLRRLKLLVALIVRQRKYQHYWPSFSRMHRRPVVPLHKRPVMRKTFPYHGVIMWRSPCWTPCQFMSSQPLSTRGGGYWSPVVNLAVADNFDLGNTQVISLEITVIFNRCRHSSAAATPVKYERSIL